ncbi:MAG TPA: polysaccharide biosynthesis tyrosine autokinase [Solirubrobacteraceae bacterium]|nr:polysaccharide biosynthesis tyrosine autokinase [Solirubrobacteraceae bacterium]
MDTDKTSLSLEQILDVIRRRALWVALCFFLVTLAAFLFSAQQTKKYTATAALVFNNNQLSQQAAGLAPVSVNNQQSQQNTNVKLVQLGDMAQRTAERLGQGLTEAKITASLGVSAQGESNIVDVSATAPSATLAADIANTYTTQFVTEQQNSNHEYYASALALVNKQLAELSRRQRVSAAGVALENRAQSLGVLAELHSGNVQVAQAAAPPTAPSSPKTGRNTILGAILGLLLGFGVAFLIERFDRRIREPKDLEEIYQLPLLGVIPESSALAGPARRNGYAFDALPDGEAEAFQLLRAHLRYFNVDRRLHTLLIASAAPGDGKTTVARHLAGAAARMGSRVLLMEVDLRRPTIARQLAIRSRPGLADVLIEVVEMRAAIQSIQLDRVFAQGSEGRTLDVLVAGAVMPPNPAALVESGAMESVLEQAKSEYDLVVIDTPPLTAVSDAFPLLGKVDGVVIVGWVGRNRRDVAQRLHETLAGAGAPLLGVVANGYSSRGLGAYGYDYAYTQERLPPPAAPTDGFSWPKGIGWPSDEDSENGDSSETDVGSDNGAELPHEPARTGKR